MQFSQGTRIMNTGIHLLIDDDDPAAIDSAIQDVEGIWFNTVRGFQSNQTRLDLVRWNTPWLEVTHSVMTTGALSGDVCAPNIAVLVKNVAPGGPPGRQYWPGLLENQVDANGLLLTGHLANWQTQTTAFFADLRSFGAAATVPYSPVVRQSDGLWREIQSTEVRALIGVQNRRLRRS